MPSDDVLPAPRVERHAPTARWRVQQPATYNGGSREREEIEVSVSRSSREGRVIRIKQARGEVRVYGAQLDLLAAAYAAALVWGGEHVDDQQPAAPAAEKD